MWPPEVGPPGPQARIISGAGGGVARGSVVTGA